MPVDETISEEVLRVVQPAAVEAAILASEEEARKPDEVLQETAADFVERVRGGKPGTAVQTLISAT